MKKILFAAILVLFAKIAQAQLVVYQIKGVVNITENGNAVKLKPPYILEENQVISVGDSSSVIIISKKGKTYRIEKQGIYSYEKIKELSAKGKQYAGTYFEYVWEELTKSKADINKEHQAFMKSKGFVTRGNEQIFYDFDTLVTFPHLVSFPNYPHNGEVYFRLLELDEKDKNHKLLKELLVNEKTINLDFSNISPGEYNLYISPSPEFKKNETITIKVIILENKEYLASKKSVLNECKKCKPLEKIIYFDKMNFHIEALEIISQCKTDNQDCEMAKDYMRKKYNMIFE